MDYVFHLLIIINIYIIATVSLNMLIGFSGILSLSHAAFYGIGAYISAILVMRVGAPYLLAVLATIVGTAVIAYLIAKPTLRLKGDYFLLASLGFQIVIFRILFNWYSLTRGPAGLIDIPRPSFFGSMVSSQFSYFIFTSVAAAIFLIFAHFLMDSPFGRVLKAIREDEIAAQSLGKNVTRFKTLIFIITGSMVGVSGSLYAHYITYINPFSFTLGESIFMLSLVIIGGMGTLAGSTVGAALLILMPEFLRFLHLPLAVAGPLRQMIYGILLIVFVKFRPQGLIGEYSFFRTSRWKL